MISKNFFDSLETIAMERGLTIEDVLSKVETAISVSSRNAGYSGDIKTEWDFEKKKIKVLEYKYVVDEIDSNGPPRGQILLEEAIKIKPKVKVGSEIKTEINLNSFSRKAASIFKQSLLSGLKELEREYAHEFFYDKVDEVINATVIDYNNGFVMFHIGKNTVATMPDKEGLPGESFNVGEVKKVYITKVEKTTKGPKVYLTRTNREIVKRLFETIIPEIHDGSIEIMGIARDPGDRTKIGVMSLKDNIDPKGACVGQGGLRIKEINRLLNNEKIDIFTWKDNPVDLIAEALLPAQSLSVITNEKKKQATVIVNDDQYSLAIGRKGQNARLAAYAIGWRIDIKKLSEATKEGIEFNYNVKRN
ncbi:MAG: transcription termination factor NusA [Bacilli bacterium]|nr:transcription termination factor NusA [Bacilli bacterium]MDD4076550.1 transcription termination factor NusA [Bacilli bacterium]MDD4387742.1 transcription termination factor NusA [Bacilli bacterium]